MGECESCKANDRDMQSDRFDINLKTIQDAAERRFSFTHGVAVSEPYWIDVDCNTVRVGVGYGKPDSDGVRPGCFGANFNYRRGEFE